MMTRRKRRPRCPASICMSQKKSSSKQPIESAKEKAHNLEVELEKVVPAPILRRVKKLIVLVIGGTVLLIGLAMAILPGPAFIVIPAGLAILGLEFAWARRLLRKTRDLIRDPKQTLGLRPDKDKPSDQ